MYAAAPFWDNAWKTADRRRIEALAEQLMRSGDTVIPYLEARGAVTVCDAGCGCGAYSLCLAVHGFRVSGFDISEDAVALTRRLLSENGWPALDFRTADIRHTGYEDDAFDAAVARDVIDHMPIREGAEAVQELLRIVRPGGCVLLTLDGMDEEYASEPHDINSDGDFVFTGGKWRGMVFHPCSPGEIERLTRCQDARILTSSGGRYTVVIEKPEQDHGRKETNAF